MTVEEITKQAFCDAKDDNEPSSFGDITDSYLYLQLYSIYRLHLNKAVSKQTAIKMKEIAVMNYKVFLLHEQMFTERIKEIPMRVVCPECGNVVLIRR